VNPVLGVMLRILGIGALVAGGLAVVIAVLVAMILLGPLVFWIAWNVLDLGQAVGLPELGFWGIVLATLFLVVGWFPKVVRPASSSSSIRPGSTGPRRCVGLSRHFATSSPSRCSPCSPHDRMHAHRNTATKVREAEHRRRAADEVATNSHQSHKSRL